MTDVRRSISDSLYLRQEECRPAVMIVQDRSYLAGVVGTPGQTYLYRMFALFGDSGSEV